MELTLEQAFEVLRSKCGNHVAAARFLELAPGYYRALRNGHSRINRRMENLIILKAMTAAQDLPAPAPVESVSQPQQAVTG
ncbi:MULTISPECIES: hypothetical protein [unclassified Desulfovibrio]|uniref:hypothetical protein n=1 Tax=unclassified Desulfovibrio TaxID=2593640 RepID=UPI0013ED4FD3|nr:MULTISPECIES: hypothetical protein [unclassified Desulfovibrio]